MAINGEMLASARIRRSPRAVFDGDAFLAADNFTVATAGTHAWYIMTGDYPLVADSLLTSTGSGEFIISLAEDVVATGGTVQSTVNPDRISTAAEPFESIHVDATVSDPGTLIIAAAYGGNNSTNVTTQVEVSTPFILKPNTGYLYSWTHNGASNRDFTVSAFFYKDKR